MDTGVNIDTNEVNINRLGLGIILNLVVCKQFIWLGLFSFKKDGFDLT